MAIRVSTICDVLVVEDSKTPTAITCLFPKGETTVNGEAVVEADAASYVLIDALPEDIQRIVWEHLRLDALKHGSGSDS